MWEKALDRMAPSSMLLIASLWMEWPPGFISTRKVIVWLASATKPKICARRLGAVRDVVQALPVVRADNLKRDNPEVTVLHNRVKPLLLRARLPDKLEPRVSPVRANNAHK